MPARMLGITSEIAVGASADFCVLEDFAGSTTPRLSTYASGRLEPM
jgi:N-acetylglucosamine-6-phosphate deacetylase